MQSFPEVLLVQQGGPGSMTGERKVPVVPREIGTAELGVQVAGVYVDYAPGTVLETGKATDLLLKGPGFFTINVPAAGNPGRVCYTRNGAFKVDSEGYLTLGGYRVMGEGGAINVGDAGFKVAPDGTIESGGTVVDRLLLVEFNDVTVLSKEDGGMFIDTQGAGGTRAVSTTVSQGYLEGSNVNVVDEMVDLVAAMRSYEANQRLIQAYDEQLSKAVNQVGSIR